MAKLTSKFFTTKATKATAYFGRGVRLYFHGRQVGSIWPDLTTGLFFASTVIGPDGEFATFEEADLFMWQRGLA